MLQYCFFLVDIYLVIKNLVSSQIIQSHDKKFQNFLMSILLVISVHYFAVCHVKAWSLRLSKVSVDWLFDDLEFGKGIIVLK